MRPLLPCAVVLLLCTLLSACDQTAQVTPAAAPAARTLTVGTSANYAPFESRNADGEIIGFDMDVVAAAAQKAGVQVQFVYTPSSEALAALEQGKRDLLASAITITEERKRSMDFSDPYFEVSQLIAVPENSRITKLADLKMQRVGVQADSTGEEVVTHLMGKTNANIKRFESTLLALTELAVGRVDAVVADNGVLIHHLAHHPNTGLRAISDASFAPEFYGLAFKKGNTQLVHQFNRGLAQIKADGNYQRIYDKYFKAPLATK